MTKLLTPIKINGTTPLSKMNESEFGSRSESSEEYKMTYSGGGNLSLSAHYYPLLTNLTTQEINENLNILLSRISEFSNYVHSYGSGILASDSSKLEKKTLPIKLSSNSNVVMELSKNKIGEIESRNIKSLTSFEPAILNETLQSNLNSTFMVNTNPIPFYVGWDESLRQFIVTNRFLSRRESGYSFIKNELWHDQKDSVNDNYGKNLLIEDFTLTPLKGMNALTTLTWITPFTTYDPDQFFVLGLDGFAPLNWRKFKFRHTILKTWLYKTENSNSEASKYWESSQYNPAKITSSGGHIRPMPILIKNKINILKVPQGGISDFTELNKNLFYKIKEKNYSLSVDVEAKYTSLGSLNKTSENVQDSKNKYRRLKKRYQRVKKYPRTPVSIPSGPLVNEVLPVHYISAFYKRSRLPRDRYLKRKFTFGALPQAKMIDSVDFTIRKRVKPTRKYHTNGNSNKNSVILPKRLKFLMDYANDSNKKTQSIRWRPFSQRTLALTQASLKNKKSIEEIIKEQLNASRLKNKRTRYFKETTDSLRTRRLKRRTLRQTIRPLLPYFPRNGGISWPGDYLQNEFVDAPLLETTNSFTAEQSLNNNSINNSPLTQTRKIEAKKTQKFITTWQMQPKKYLLEKHNLKVLKKKLEKAYRSHKLKEKVATL